MLAANQCQDQITHSHVLDLTCAKFGLPQGRCGLKTSATRTFQRATCGSSDWTLPPHQSYTSVTSGEFPDFSQRFRYRKVRLATFVIPSRCFGIESGFYGPFEEPEEVWATGKGSYQFCRHDSLTARLSGNAHATDGVAHGRRYSGHRCCLGFRITAQVDGPILQGNRAESGCSVSGVSGDTAKCATHRDGARVPLSNDDGRRSQPGIRAWTRFSEIC